ncbi:MAG: ATP-binding cassette domain-containing protein [Treponema sp.]|nr:ATP-binding cassette domain-containing protein [Treponema sp.]
MRNLICVKNCRIENTRETVLPVVDWEMHPGEAWLVIGPNGGGKADFINALAGKLHFVANQDSDEQKENQAGVTNIFADSVELVSLERAAKLIEEERQNDESDYVEGGIDIGRTGRVFIAQGILECKKDVHNDAFDGKDFKAQILHQKAVLEKLAGELDAYPEIKLCGVEKILDRGLKYMSTGEIRRTLLARALISGKKLLILSDPFAGLDVQSRTILLDFFNTIFSKQLKRELKEDSLNEEIKDFPSIILGMERWHEIPDAITNVIEFADKKISFCGSRADYEKLLEKREQTNGIADKSEKKELFANQLKETVEATLSILKNDENDLQEQEEKIVLVEMNDVNVGWGDHQVLRNLNWKLYKGDHWLIQGPNGSGKTTFLELITGDNMQVFSNDVRLFGNKRGSGETIWDIKKRLGIVSYRMHVEYRMLGGTSLQNVIVSGFRDSIGLYGAATDLEISSAKKWLALGGFDGRENESFGNLSYGEQRAILILRSAVKNPEILILDEPCHGLDEQYREKILNLMDLIGKGGTTTMLHVTHDPSEVLDCEKHILQLQPEKTPMYQIIVR